MLHKNTATSHFVLWVSIAIAAGYACTLFWFARIDFYHTHFFDHGSAVTLYQIMRIVFMAYLAWLIYVVGMGVLILCKARDSLITLPAWERYPLAFLTGAGAWHLLLFIAGLAGWDTRTVAATLTLSVMIFSIPHMAGCLDSVSGKLRLSSYEPTPPLHLLLYALLALAVGSFLLTKGTYPGGGHDYYDHYFAFYKRVIETGSILPNDVWYHFYYSKGAGLYFLAMLLTDPLAPQLVTSVFFLSSACIIFALLRHVCTSAVLPLTGAILYIVFFIYTPGPNANVVEGGWGNLEKIHEMTAVLMLGMVWISSRLFTYSKIAARPWMLALHGAVFTAILLTFPLTLFIGIYMGLLFLWFLWRREYNNIRHTIGVMLTAGCTAFVIMLINYHYTGLPTDHPLLLLWNFANLQKLQHWGVLFELMAWHQRATELQAHTILWSWDVVPLVATFLRFDIWWPFMVGTLPLFGMQFYRYGMRFMPDLQATDRTFRILALYLLAIILFAVFAGGRSEAISFYRFSSFSYGVMMCVALLTWRVALASPHSESVTSSTGRTLWIAIAFMAASVTAITVPLHIKSLRNFDHVQSIFANASDVWSGNFSLKDAYRNQQGWPGSMASGGIYPGMEIPWKIAGPGTRIWSFHVHSYCMLPDCNMQGFFSMRFSPHWQTVFFDTPAHAASVLRIEGLNYFFFSKELDLRDPLPNAPLFSPEHIAGHLAIRWTDGTSYLLTWPGPDTRPIGRTFLDAYSAAIKRSSTVQGFSVPVWKAISDHINHHAGDLRPFRLPWCITCDYFPLQPLD